MAKQLTNALYIDDFGTKEYAERPTQYSDKGGKSRYFVFGGLLATVQEARRLSDRIAGLKTATFGTKNVEIKANWLAIQSKKKVKYLDFYGIGEPEIDHFVELFYDEIARADVRLFAAVVDKVQVQEKYADPWNTPALAYEFLVQRVVLEVTRAESARVVIDDMEGATPRGNQYRENLKRQHRGLLRHGSRLQERLDFSPLLPKIIFIDSADSNLIQAADAIAYNVNNQFNMYGNEWDKGVAGPDGKLSLPTHGRFECLLKRFCRGPNGRVQGFGVVKFPKPIGGPVWGVE